MRHPNTVPGPELETSFNAAEPKISNYPRLINKQAQVDKDTILPFTELASNPTMS